MNRSSAQHNIDLMTLVAHRLEELCNEVTFVGGCVTGLLITDKAAPDVRWVSAGIGVGFNISHGFYNRFLISQAVIQNNFAAYTQTSFTHYWQAELGYEFADWGQSPLNRASGQTQGQGLSLGHLYPNGLMFNLNYTA